MIKHVPIKIYEEIKSFDGLMYHTFNGVYRWFNNQGYPQLYKVTVINNTKVKGE